MFSLLLASSLPQPPQPVSATHALFPLPASHFPAAASSSALTLFPAPASGSSSDTQADATNHSTAAVFLTGQAPLPDGTATSVHCYVPPDHSHADDGGWRVVGTITNASPSLFLSLPPRRALTLPSPSPSIAAFPPASDAPLLGLVLEPAATCVEIEEELARLREVTRDEEQSKKETLRQDVGWVAARV
ncbi:hypothetical protein FA09DRAFT_327051, partial [Tilletiopsis washingtonensis]